MTAQRIAVLGPCHTAPFEEHLMRGTGTTSLPPGMGGYNITHLVLARLARGLRTDVITCDPSVSATMRFKGPLLRLWVVPRRQRRTIRDLYRQERQLLREAIAESAPDCLHANWANEYAFAASQANRPWVLSMHDNPAALIRWIGSSQIVGFLLSLRLMRRAMAVTGVSPYVCEYVKRFGRRHAMCVPNLLHLPLLDAVPVAPTPSAAAGETVVSVLNWSAFKNARRGLQAFQELRRQRPNATLHLVGPGLESGGPADAWGRMGGLASGVVFRGVLPYASCIELIRNARVLFHPALEESMGCQVAEAMALGTHVVCSRQAKGPAWLTEQGRFGSLVDGTRVAAMSDALVGVLSRSPADEARAAEAARQHILAVTDANGCLSQYDAVYARSIRATS